MFQLTLVKGHARLLASLKNRRRAAMRFRRSLLFFRKLKIPVYKNLYDALNFFSYYTVLDRIMPKKEGGGYFEWGPGHNTRLALRHMKHVFSVENDSQWHKKYNKEFPVILSPISQESCLNYPFEIKKISESIDLAFVDGRCRIQCIAACAEKGVPIVVMHDSLHPHTFVPACDGAPPASSENVFYYTGYTNYRYFVEAVDLRTIVLVNSESDFEMCKELFSDFYLRAGETSAYAHSAGM